MQETNLTEMKSLLLLCATICCACCTSVQPKHYPDYTVSTGFTLDSADARNPQVVENLGVACRVWGYAKYHHPAFADSKFNADYELFGLLPLVAKATPAERNKALYEWVRRLGGFSTEKAEYDEALKPLKCVETADLGWTRDTARLGGPLSQLLQELRYATRKGNRYTDYAPGSGNFVMSNESTAGSSDDCGYRMLYLFRFWNVIEYFAPNRNLTDTEWSEIPEKYIPLFIPKPAPGNPNQAILRRELCDSHAAAVQYNMFGYNAVPAEVRNADERVFVIADGELRKGDEILSIDGRGWGSTHAALSRFESASNDENRNYMAALCMVYSHRDTAAVELVRNGRRITKRIATLSIMDWDLYVTERMLDTANIRLIADGVGYMTGLNYTPENGPRIMEKFRDTKALIVDMRCYPRNMIPDFIGQYFMPRTAPHVIWTNPTGILPGVFYQTQDLLPVNPDDPSVTENPDYYKGRVIVLVDSSTQSYAEYTVMAFQATPRCTVVGTQTAGADGNMSALVMPGGPFGYFSGLGVLYPDGTNAQRTGVRIDVPVHATVAGLQAGRDEILEKALEIIRTGAYDPADKI